MTLMYLIIEVCGSLAEHDPLDGIRCLKTMEIINFYRIHTLTHPLTHSLTHSLTHTLTHSLTHSLIHTHTLIHTMAEFHT